MDSIKEEIMLDLGKVLPNMIESTVSQTLNNCFDKQLQHGSTSTGCPLVVPSALNSGLNDQEKHIVVLEDSELTEKTWATVTKRKIALKLKNVPVTKTVLNEGQACIFLPSKKNSEQAVAALESDFKVTATSRKTRKMLPNLQICNIDGHDLVEKEDQKSAILEKNVEIKECLDQNENSVFDVIFISEKGKFLSQYAVIKVSHCIRNVILTTGRLFIHMESHFANDHFHIDQ